MEHKTGAGCLDDFARAAGIVHHGRGAECHRLDDRQAKGFGRQRRQHNGGGAGVELGKFFCAGRAQEFDLGQAVEFLLQCGQQIATARHLQTQSGVRGKLFQHRAQTLRRSDTADEQKVARLRRQGVCLATFGPQR